jgi:hypothetical protein
MTEVHAVVVIPRWAPLDRMLGKIAKALEGRNSWGYFETSILSRGAWMRERLVLFPPGTDASERRALTLYRRWPVVGACLALVFMMVIGVVLPPALAFTVAFSLYGVMIWRNAMTTRRLRDESLQLVVLTVATGGHVVWYGNVESMQKSRAALLKIDAGSNSGDLSASEYELEWASLFWSLEADRDRLDAELHEGILSSEGFSTRP